MRSVDVVFPRPGVVEVRESNVAAPGPGQVTCRARTSLVSTGTETFCLAGEFDAGTVTLRRNLWGSLLGGSDVGEMCSGDIELSVGVGDETPRNLGAVRILLECLPGRQCGEGSFDLVAVFGQ